jgi:chitinase
MSQRLPDPRRLGPATWSDGATRSPLDGPPLPRLSMGRALAALLVVAVAIAAAGFVLLAPSTSSSLAQEGTAAATYAPYVDVTLTPAYAFQDPTANPVSDVVLGFVVAAPGASACTPSWGGAYSLDQAESTLDLDRAIAQTTKQGGNATVSFGGQANTELAVTCTGVRALTAAYLSVIDRYDLHTVDFDIEGAALGDTAANDRRAQAIAAIQRRLRAKHRTLRVWLTLPVAPTGFTSEGRSAIAAMLRAGVELTGVNAMAMNFAPAETTEHGMLGATKQSLNAAHGQLDALTRHAGPRLSARELWNRLGVTVMIGRNDVPGQVFSLSDARGLTEFVTARHIRRVSSWSLNRDAQCGSVFAQVAVLSNTCSGIKQATLAFTHIFMRLPGTTTATASTLRRSAVPQVAEQPVDDPATSPYPIWKAGAVYGAGYKVVWHHDVYQAKWYSQNQVPDGPASDASDTPWLLLGPVHASDRAMRIGLPAKHGFPAWSPTSVYRKGARVRYRGLPYEARWWVQATVPDTTMPADAQSPWRPLFTIIGEPGEAIESS